MVDVVERIARALAIYQFGSPASWEDQVPMALVVIEATRKPTKAGSDCDMCIGSSFCGCVAEKVWLTMVATAEWYVAD